MAKLRVDVYTDGAFSRGYGGWAAILYFQGDTLCVAGDSSDDPVSPTTNNRMEMIAVIKALESLKAKTNVVIHCDSQYVVQGMNYLAEIQRRRGWITSDGSPVKNRDLWEQLLALKHKHSVKVKWVPGHAGIEGNEIVNDLAQNMRLKMEERAKEGGK